MRAFGAALAALLAMTGAANAQSTPQGTRTLNQAVQARLLTKSDTTTYQPSRGLFIGDATACNIAILLKSDTAAVTFANVQSGALLPFQITKLMSTNTTCTSVVGLW